MLSTVDLNKSLTKEEYVRDLIRYQLQLRALAFQLYAQKRPLVIVYEGWDAGGKGGNIKRITEKLDPRGYEVYPIAAPAGEDKTHHYLWRFWRRLKPPDEKQILFFDRSWYGRVMVERLEGFCTEEEWKRAYREINEFERQLVDFGTVLVKFWIHISKEEQLARFEARKETPYKAWKLTDEDWRNREKWDLYEEAINDMLLKTSTLTAPWTIIEGNCKWYARVKALRTLVETLTDELDYIPPDTVPKPKVKKDKKKEGKKKKGKKDAKGGKKKRGKKYKKKGSSKPKGKTRAKKSTKGKKKRRKKKKK
jgi:polyphosphate kinase 2 (PPK2 family)